MLWLGMMYDVHASETNSRNWHECSIYFQLDLFILRFLLKAQSQTTKSILHPSSVSTGSCISHLFSPVALFHSDTVVLFVCLYVFNIHQFVFFVMVESLKRKRAVIMFWVIVKITWQQCRDDSSNLFQWTEEYCTGLHQQRFMHRLCFLKYYTHINFFFNFITSLYFHMAFR